MVIRFRNQSENPFIKNVSFMFIVYWGGLVLWQNIGLAETRESIDLVIKMGLIVYFTVFYLLRAKTFNAKALITMALAMCLLVTASSEKQFPLSNVIAYVYPILILFLVYGLGDSMEINCSHLLAFCNCVICITGYAAIYAVLFRWEQFAGVFSVENAYGNELSSFFISSHEYGTYLVASIISAIICLRLDSDMSRLRKSLYIMAIVLFGVNLILTFSRTSMLGLAVFLTIYSFFEVPKAKKWIITVCVLIGAVLILFPSLSEFVYKIVLKENDDAGRTDLFQYGVQYYNNGTVFQKVFGHGIYETRANFEKYYDYGSVHNGYLQVLLYYGLIGCSAMVVFILAQVFIGIRFIKKDRLIGTLSLALILCAASMMLTNTMLIFQSSIDSFFLTAFFVLVPKYVRNSVLNQGFY